MTTLYDIYKKSLTSGLNGASAMTIQVGSLMWMRTIMNYQYRYGGQILNTVNLLYNDGGLRRFYRGVGAALFQGPLSRFGDTFSNTLALSLCKENDILKKSPILIQTAFASTTAGLFRILLMPIDTVKTILQVEGKQGLSTLHNKIKVGGPSVMFHGAIATASATMVGHYPWFMTFNMLDTYLPNYSTKLETFVRNATIGFSASIVSDTLSNSLRVIKTAKQAYKIPVNYTTVTQEILKKEGIFGLLGRGLKIRLLTNGIQGLLFSVIWKYLETK